MDNVDNLTCKKIFPYIHNVSGSHSYQQISGLEVFGNKILYFFKGIKIRTVPTKRFDFGLQGGGTDPQIVRLPCGINFCKHNPVRKRERLCEVPKEGFGTRIGVRLEYAPQSFVGIICGSLQGCGNFCWVMRIIIYYSDTVESPLILEAPVGACKAGESLCHGLCVYGKKIA